MSLVRKFQMGSTKNNLLMVRVKTVKYMKSIFYTGDLLRTMKDTHGVKYFRILYSKRLGLINIKSL